MRAKNRTLIEINRMADALIRREIYLMCDLGWGISAFLILFLLVPWV